MPDKDIEDESVIAVRRDRRRTRDSNKRQRTTKIWFGTQERVEQIKRDITRSGYDRINDLLSDRFDDEDAFTTDERLSDMKVLDVAVEYLLRRLRA